MRYEGRYVTYEWAGEPHASESIKRVDGVEVARNHVPGFGAWSGRSGVEVISGSHARLTGGTIDLTEALAVPIRPGARRIAWHAQARSTFIRNGTDPEEGRAGVHSGLRDDGGTTVGSARPFPAGGEWHDVEFSMSLGDDATTAWIRLLSDSDFSSPEYEVRRFRYAFDGEEPEPYFDGDTLDGPHGFTWDWWGRLPRHVRDADRAQGPISVPLLRFLDGIGHQAGRIQDQHDAMWSGAIFDPETTPDELLEWVAYLLGFTANRRDHPPGGLRESILDHIAGGTHQVGARQQIAATIRPYLNPGARVQVLASSSARHTLIIGVGPDDVPDQDYDRLTRQIRAAGVVPAGHALLVQNIRATWDQWEAAAGDTWEEKEANIVSWQDSDRAGVELQ